MKMQMEKGNPWKLKQVKRKVELCEQSLDYLNIAQPGISSLKSGIILELGPSSFVLIQHDLRKGKDKSEVAGKLNNLIELMSGCLDNYLLHEEEEDDKKAE